MDYVNLLLGIVALAGLVGLAWVAGYELGSASGASTERELANRRINGVLESVNSRRPKAAKNRRKAALKGSSGGALW